MKREIIIVAITAFFIVNTYYDGKYIDIMRGWKKYYTMIGYAFAGLSVMLYMKKMGSSGQYSDILTDASNLIKHIPIDQDSSDVITPMMGFMKSNFTTQFQPNQSGEQYTIPPQQKRMMRSGDGGSKRSVGETKKKYVAAQQGWACGKCHQQLSAWFEVDHEISLENGGSNEVSNLVALCRECHGEKTAMARF